MPELMINIDAFAMHHIKEVAGKKYKELTQIGDGANKRYRDLSASSFELAVIQYVVMIAMNKYVGHNKIVISKSRWLDQVLSRAIQMAAFRVSREGKNLSKPTHIRKEIPRPDLNS